MWRTILGRRLARWRCSRHAIAWGTEWKEFMGAPSRPRPIDPIKRPKSVTTQALIFATPPYRLGRSRLVALASGPERFPALLRRRGTMRERGCH